MGQPTSTMQEIKGTAKTPWEGLLNTERTLQEFNVVYRNAKIKILKNLIICNRAQKRQRICDIYCKKTRRSIDRTRIMLIVARIRHANLRRILPTRINSLRNTGNKLRRRRVFFMMSAAQQDIKMLKNQLTFQRRNYVDFSKRYKHTCKQLNTLQLAESEKLKFLENIRENLKHRRKVLMAMKNAWADNDWTQLESFLDT